MNGISFINATPNDREFLLGREFRYIDVESADFSGRSPMVAILLDGKRTVLVGDPAEALRTYLGGAINQRLEGPQV